MLHAAGGETQGPVGSAVAGGLSGSRGVIVVDLAEGQRAIVQNRIAGARIAIFDRVGQRVIVVEGLQPDAAGIGDPSAIAQHALARQVRRWLDEAPVLASTGHPLTPGDILVLVRSRGELASLIVARLFSAGVPVAGVDRLHLHEPLAVQDLLAAVKFAVQPNDDLSLASLLVSPLIGWDQDQLRDLAYARKGSLWRELRERAADFPETHEALAELLRIADFTTPSRFLETILTGPMQGRRRLYSRLGTAARDAIDVLGRKCWYGG